jgi:hypothetical protein
MRFGWLPLVPPFAILFLAVAAAHAQAGPPFKTDDPETPGNRHWEINFGWLGSRGAAAGDYSIPDFDINYGLGERIQLKYELPIAVHEECESADSLGQEPIQEQVVVGLGESLLGVKWRFYQYRPAWSTPPTASEEPPEVKYSVSTYPQLSLNNPTASVQRGVVLAGPQFLFPLEVNARFGPIRVDAEAGYWFTNHNVPQSWIRGAIIGHEFTPRTETYLELYDQQDANRVGGAAKQRQATLGLGGRHALNKSNTLLLLLMGGAAFRRWYRATGNPAGSPTSASSFFLGQTAKHPRCPISRRAAQAKYCSHPSCSFDGMSSG